MQLITILLSIVIMVLSGLSLFLFFYCLKINKSIDLLLEKGKIKDLRNVFLSQINKSKEIETDLDKVKKRMKNLENISKTTFQKIGVVRFNPFADLGGNQSFSIALLDGQDNGFIISSLFIKEGNRVFAKPIINGKSKHILSKEEIEAMNKAIGLVNLKSKIPKKIIT